MSRPEMFGLVCLGLGRDPFVPRSRFPVASRVESVDGVSPIDGVDLMAGEPAESDGV